MRTTLSFLLASLAMAMLVNADMQLFAQFQRDHKKFYASEEFLYRYSVFRNNLQKVASLQANAVGEVEYGVTPFFDLTEQEFASQYLLPQGVLQNFAQSMHEDTPHHTNERELRTATSIPTSFDWRNNNRTVLTPVYNQGSCGSCWAFSAMENLESLWAISGKPLVSLSAQQLVDCDNNDGGCNGGWPTRAYNYIKSAGGLDTLASYPYTGRGGSCKFSSSHIGAKFSSWVYVTQSKDETAMATYVATKGPISVCVDADTWQYYRSGVITTGSNCGTSLNHCVLITGYGVSSSGTKVWNVRNQWGTGFGNKGYLQVQRGANVCGIASVPTSVVI